MSAEHREALRPLLLSAGQSNPPSRSEVHASTKSMSHKAGACEPNHDVGPSISTSRCYVLQ